MSGLGGNVFINTERAFWLREVPPDVSHSTITVQELDASIARISTATIDDLTVSSAVFSTFGVQNLDVSGMYVSSLNGNSGFFSSITFASDLSGGVGFVRFHVDASGIQVDGDPIRFDNLVYLTSTINIIQVSTLVDTDIFAQRGFFSTLSSGNFFASKAFISSLEVTDLSGFSERNWSLYPTLSGEIIFSTGYNLSNVGSNLFFAGQQLATPADISGIDTWSYHPALSSLKMNNQVITGLSTINFQDGATLTSQTGNNLFYNGQAVQYGASSNVSQWANYPAVTTVQLSNNGITATGSIPIAATSNVSITAQRISTVADQGLLNPTVNSDINLTAQNGLKGRINMTANPGALGLFGEINMTANGGTVAGVGTGGLVTITANTPLGTLCNATSAIKFSASGINSYAGAIPSVGSLAGYNFIYGTGGVNICAGIPSVFPNTPLTTFLYGTAGVVSGADFYVPNIYPYWNGLTTPPDLFITGRYIIPNLAQVYVQLSNVKNIYMDAGAQILNARYVSTVSTVGQNANFNTGTFGTVVAGAVGASAGIFTTIEAGSISSSVVTAPLLSTININLSTINGIDWQDISGSVYTTTSSFSTLFTSSLSGYGGLPIEITSPLFFSGPDAIDNLAVINTTPDVVPILQIGASTMVLEANNVLTNSLSTTRLQTSSFLTSSFATTNLAAAAINTSSLVVSTIAAQNGAFPVEVIGGLKFANPNSFQNVLNINTDQTLNVNVFADRFGVVAFNTLIGSLSTTNIQASNVKVSTLHAVGTTIDVSGSMDVTGGMFLNDTLELPLATGGINFDDGSGLNYTRMMRRDIANNNMLSVVDTPGLSSNNMMPLGVGELWLTGGADQYDACRLYSVFPYGNYELDAIDENGTTLFAYIQGYYNPLGVNPGYLQSYSNVSSISGYDEQNSANRMLNVINGITTSNLVISSINGAAYPPGGGGGTINQFSTLFVSSLNFSSAISYTSNTAINLPIFVEHDAAGALSNSGAAIAVSGHNFSVGAVVQQIEMGWRATGENYIASYWPGQNLEDLQIESSQLLITNGVQSSFMNYAGHALQTGNDILVGTTQIAPASVSTSALFVSSINGNDPTPAYLNALTLSSMTLYSGSTTLMSLDSRTAFSNINISGYDAVVGVNGTYKIGTSFQFLSPGSADEVEFFILKNNVPISYGGGICEVANNVEIIQYCEIVEPLVNGDSIQVGCFTNGANVFVSTVVGTAIQSPAMILTMYKVD